MGEENLDESFERLLLTSDSENDQRMEEDPAGDEDEDEDEKEDEECDDEDDTPCELPLNRDNWASDIRRANQFDFLDEDA